VTYPEVTKETRNYKSKVRAEKMAGKLFERCGYIVSWKVEKI
jgi:hypothetical protein